MNKSLRSFLGLINRVFFMSVVLSLGVFSGRATVFNANAGTLGAIPDGGIATTCGSDGTPLDVTFTVAGISTAPASVEVSTTFLPIHTWRADLTATLIAPNGTSFILYRYIGSTTAAG